MGMISMIAQSGPMLGWVVMTTGHVVTGGHSAKPLEAQGLDCCIDNNTQPDTICLSLADGAEGAHRAKGQSGANRCKRTNGQAGRQQSEGPITQTLLGNWAG
jgi:hypothetical protein